MAEKKNSDMARLSLLMQLEAMAREADSLKALQFMMTNETRHLIAYRQAFLFSTDVDNENKFQLQTASSIAVIDRTAPFVNWLESTLNQLHKDSNMETLQILDAARCPEAMQEEWKEYSLPFVLWCPLKLSDGKSLGGVWLARETPWTDSDSTLVKRLADTYAHAWYALLGRQKLQKMPHYERIILGSVAFIIISFFVIPVRISALAPVEVVARDPAIVSAPMDGVIAEVIQAPNVMVSADTLLLKYEDTGLRNKYAVAEKALAVAVAEFHKASQEAFGDPQSSAKVALLKAQVELSRAESKYAMDLLNQVEVKAQKKGLLIYSDKSDWEGRPVQVGEQIMQIANPEKVKLRINLPVDDAIFLVKGGDVKIFLDVDPLNSIEGKIIHASYEADLTPEGVLAYRIDAEFSEPDIRRRIGLQGTAKLYEKRVSFFYYLFRRPISAMRQFLGV
jgi:multidrug resistance efflux pump